jgi:threonine/homoserine efflux transporter RhtA
MNRVGPAIIGTVILIGIVRLLSNKAVDVLDVVGATALSLGIALWILYIVKNRARR